MGPSISVIIPTYNRAHCICNAIESVLGQTRSDYEIIVIDDGSTDNTREVLQVYSSKIVHISQENKGVSAARNTGIKVAQGEWIAFLDSDDEWLPSKLELQMKDVKLYPNAVLSCTNVIFKGQAELQSIDFFRGCLFENRHRVFYVKEPNFKCYAITSTVLVKRKAIIDVGMFDEQLSIFEDGDLFFRLSTQGGFVVNPSPLVVDYRRKESADLNLSVQFLKNKEKYYISIIKSCDKYKKFTLTAGQEQHVKMKISSSWFELGILYHKAKKKGKARNCFFNSCRVKPSGKTIFKLFLGLSGTLGIKLVEKNRNANKVFRRSEYYHND